MIDSQENTQILTALYFGLLNRKPDPSGLELWNKRLERVGLSAVISGLIDSDEFIIRYAHKKIRSGGMDNAIKIIGWLMQLQVGKILHPIRCDLIKNILPAKELVLDLGGASSNPVGALTEMGYCHAKEITIVDLPLDTRLKSGPDIKSSIDFNGSNIKYNLHNMSDLSSYANDSFDLVWSGQTFEHITKSEGIDLFSQVRRVLKPGGVFALDTPNRTVTRLLVGADNYIHVEHKFEWEYLDFIDCFSNSGLQLIDTRGLLNMTSSLRSGCGALEDLNKENYMVNNTPETSYAFYVAYRKDF